MFLYLLSQGNQKQRWLPGMDPLLPRHVLFLSPLPGLVWQLTQLPAWTLYDIKLPGSGTYWLSHRGVMPTLRPNTQFPKLNPVDKSFMKMLDSSGDGSVFFPHLNYLLILSSAFRAASLFNSTSVETSFVGSTVSNLMCLYGLTVSFSTTKRSVNSFVGCNYSCLTDWKTVFLDPIQNQP